MKCQNIHMHSHRLRFSTVIITEQQDNPCPLEAGERDAVLSCVCMIRWLGSVRLNALFFSVAPLGAQPTLHMEVHVGLCASQGD